MSLGLANPYLHQRPKLDGSKWRLSYITTIVYLAIQVACFDCIMNMIGHLFNLHIIKSMPNNQTWKRQGFLILFWR